MRTRTRLSLAVAPAIALILSLPGAAQDEPQGPPRPGEAAPVASPATAAARSATPASVATPAAPRRRAGRLEMRGMGVPLHSLDPEHDYRLDELPELGVTHVAIFVKMFQPDVGSPAPARHPLRSTSDRELRDRIAGARRLGLQVALVPIVELERRERDDWRGKLRPPSWPRWFAGYRRELLHWARLAEDAGASLLSVGSELSSSEAQATLWRETIAAARTVFSGDLTYSANWDHYEGFPAWGALDYIGLSGYYELWKRDAPVEPTLEALQAAWAKQRRALAGWRHMRGLSQPLVFVEVGYTSLDGCARTPWDYTQGGGQQGGGKRDLDLEEQLLCYQAFANAWAGAPELAGTFFYEWWGDGGRRDGNYTPRGKPALEVLQAFYGVRKAP